MQKSTGKILTVDSKYPNFGLWTLKQSSLSRTLQPRHQNIESDQISDHTTSPTLQSCQGRGDWTTAAVTGSHSRERIDFQLPTQIDNPAACQEVKVEIGDAEISMSSPPRARSYSQTQRSRSQPCLHTDPKKPDDLVTV